MTSIHPSTPSVIASQHGWRKVVLDSKFYNYLIGITLLVDCFSSMLLHPIDFNSLNSTDLLRSAYLLLSLVCFTLMVVTRHQTIMSYVLLCVLMLHPLLIVNSGLLDVRMSVHYVSIAFLIQVGQQIQQLSYKAFILLTLTLLILFLSMVLKPKLNIDETSLALKIQMCISILYSGIFIFTGILVQRAKSYYITIDKELSEQIRYITDQFSKINSLTPSLQALLGKFKDKTNLFFKSSQCELLVHPEKLVKGDLDLDSSFKLSESDKNADSIQQIMTNKLPLLIGKFSKIKGSIENISPDSSLLIVPITRNNEVIGLFKITNSKSFYFKESHLHLTKLIAAMCAAKILEFENRVLSLQSFEIEIESQHLQELDELKYNFIENISKSIKAPLRSLLAKTKILDDHTEDLKQKKLIQLIRSNSTQLKKILDQLLELNEIDVTTKELQLNQINISKLIHDWQHTFSRIAKQRNIDFKLNGPSSLTVIGDEKKLTSIIHNLVNNALKYTPNYGTVEVDYGLNENTFYLHVNDSGQGIPAPYREKIFDRFFRLGEADGKGTGIGLSIVKELTEILGGKIEISDSKLGGASFQFSYNIRYVEGVLPPNLAMDNEEKSLPLENEQKMVLIIDDHEEMREFITNCLNADYNCVQAANGRIGLALAQKIIPDIIITDLMMPGMNGEELCAQVRSNLELSHIPIVVLSAMSTGEDKIRLYEIGADNYLVKPFEVVELKAIIESLLQARTLLTDQFKAKYLKHDAVEETYENREKNFLEKVQQTVLDNLTNEDFNVVSLCTILGMGRNQTQRKIKALTGMTPVEFIRETKLKEAAIRLLETDASISTIANETGFNNLSYFTKVFKSAYGILPFEYKNQKTI